MDIKKAKKGTVPPATQTSEAPQVPTPPVDAKGNVEPALNVTNAEEVAVSQYWNFLKEQGITQEDVEDILDSILVSGNVSWEFQLFDRIPVKFQIRPAWADTCILSKIDDLTADDRKISQLRYSTLVAEYNLAASMVRLGDREFVLDGEGDLERNRDYVRKMTYIMQVSLINKLAVFDRAVTVATSEWFLRNFSRPRKDK